MALLNLSVTVPDAQMARVQAAARFTYGQVPNGTGGMRDMTNAELTEAIRQDVIKMLKRMVQDAERRQAELTPLPAPVDPT